MNRRGLFGLLLTPLAAPLGKLFPRKHVEGAQVVAAIDNAEACADITIISARYGKLVIPAGLLRRGGVIHMRAAGGVITVEVLN